MEDQEMEKMKMHAKRKVELEALESITFEQLKEKVNEWLLIADSGIIKVICATIIANRLPASPLWLFLVAPSGGGKTDLLRALNDLEDIYPLSTLTTQTFISGKQGNDASLLFEINGKILTFKDFTTILQSHPQVQSEILAQLREIYDGQYNKDFGTGGRKKWDGKLGFIAGVTSVIDKHHNVHKSLGERFLQYRIIQPDRMEVMKRIEKNVLKKAEMEKSLADAFFAFLKGVKIPPEIPEVPQEFNEKIKLVSNFISTARSAVIRDSYSRSREIEMVPEPEMSTRIYHQIRLMAIGLMIINGNGSLAGDDYKILLKLGFDSIHALRRKVLEIIRDYKGWVNTDVIALKTVYSTPTIRNHVEELTALGIIERMKPRKNLIIWRLKEQYRQMWADCEIEPSKTAGTLSDSKAESDSQKGEYSPTEEDEKAEEDFNNF